jgi:hypothetical protein
MIPCGLAVGRRPVRLGEPPLNKEAIIRILRMSNPVPLARHPALQA